MGEKNIKFPVFMYQTLQKSLPPPTKAGTNVLNVFSDCKWFWVKNPCPSFRSILLLRPPVHFRKILSETSLARISIIQETAWNWESTTAQAVLLEKQTCKKEKKECNIYVKTTIQLHVTIFLFHLTQSKVQSISKETKPHLWNIYKR